MSAERVLWLSKDEKKVLAFYSRELDAGQRLQFRRSEFKTTLRGVDIWKRIKIATVRLKRLNLVDSQEQGDAITVGLNFEGYGLGKICNSRFGIIWAWCTQYKVVFVILGFITTLLVTTSTLLITIFRD